MTKVAILHLFSIVGDEGMIKQENDIKRRCTTDECNLNN